MQARPDPLTPWNKEVHRVQKQQSPSLPTRKFLAQLLKKPSAASLFFSLSLSLRFGRHPVLILSVLFMLVFGLTVAFSVNVTMFSTLRFFEGFCLAGLALSLYVLSKYQLSASHAFFSICSPAPHCLCRVKMLISLYLHTQMLTFSMSLNQKVPTLVCSPVVAFC